QINRFEGLDALSKLKSITIAYNPINSMVGLGNKPYLENLTIYRTKIYKLEDYASLKKMSIGVNGDFSFEDNKDALKALKRQHVRVERI
ncbi:MAG: hypothetical protein V7629_21425, partial [Motiliproteus sp.]